MENIGEMLRHFSYKRARRSNAQCTHVFCRCDAEPLPPELSDIRLSVITPRKREGADAFDFLTPWHVAWIIVAADPFVERIICQQVLLTRDVRLVMDGMGDEMQAHPPLPKPRVPKDVDADVLNGLQPGDRRAQKAVAKSCPRGL